MKPKFHGFVFKYCGDAPPNPGGGGKEESPSKGDIG